MSQWEAQQAQAAQAFQAAAEAQSNYRQNAAPASLADTVAEMRRLGVTRLKTPELEVDLGPAPAPPPKELSANERQEADLSEEDKEERAWRKLFERATRASGAPIPPFPRRGPKLESNIK